MAVGAESGYSRKVIGHRLRRRGGELGDPGTPWDGAALGDSGIGLVDGAP